MARIAVIGGGYVGLVTSACLAHLGHQVTCLEVNPARLDRLRQGILPIFEPGLDDLVDAGCRDGLLSFTSDYSGAIPSAEFVFLAVNTPPLADGSPDTTFVFSAVDMALPYAADGLCFVVKSTVPIGTGDKIAAKIADAGHSSVHVVSNPEFLRQGTAVNDFLMPDRIVIGAVRKRDGDAVQALYEGVPGPVILCSSRSAELAKYAANALLASRISFMNEIAGLADHVGADIEEVSEVLRADPRIGPFYLRAGLGWGGSCFPKDVQALAWLAREAGYESSIAEAAYHANYRQRDFAIERILAAIEGQPNATVGVLGLAFKPDTDDLREAPAIDIINRLVARGVTVRAHDPVAMENAKCQLPNSVVFCEDAYDAARDVDVVFLATEWRDYVHADWREITRLMRGKTVFDGRHVLDKSALTVMGLDYLSFGRQVDIGRDASDVAAGAAATLRSILASNEVIS